MIEHPSRPLLVIDGDSFAHRAYHGLPKSIRRHGNRGGGAIVGFANFLLRMYESERPRAVLVGWDTLDVPTYRHRAFAAYQSGRQFDPELRDQLDVLPHFVAACGFVCAKSPGYEADDFLAAAVADEELRGGTAMGSREKMPGDGRWGVKNPRSEARRSASRRTGFFSLAKDRAAR
jgi:DNA polymerase I